MGSRASSEGQSGFVATWRQRAGGLGTLFLGLAVAAALASPAAAADAKGKKIAFLDSLHTHPFVSTLTDAFLARAKGYGLEVTVFTSQLDAALQAQQVDDAIAQKFDLLAIISTAEQAVVPALVRAKQAGIPVILVNNPPKPGTEDLYVSFVGQDQTEQGRLTGAAVLRALKESGRDGGKIALVTGALQMGPGPRRVAGFREAIKANPKAEIVAVEDAHWDTAQSERVTGQLFARFAATGGLDVVFGMADNQAVAAIHAADAAGIPVGDKKGQLIVVGSNCLKEGIDAIKAGKMYSTLSQIPGDIGDAAADAANDYLSGKTLKKDILLTPVTITRANVGAWEKKCTY